MQQGHCPKCNNHDLDYGVVTPDGDSIFYPVICSCGFKGKEYYNLTFSTYYDDKGNEIE